MTWRTEDKGAVSIGDLVGHVLSSASLNKERTEILFSASGERMIWRMYHRQSCCEDVYVEDICGDLEHLVGRPIISAEMSSNSGEVGDEYDTSLAHKTEGLTEREQSSYTWTFYKITTMAGSVTIRWYGTSSGAYSEEVDFIKYVPATSMVER